MLLTSVAVSVVLVSVSLLSLLSSPARIANSESVAADIAVVDSSGFVGRYTSLVVDSHGLVHISYYDSTNGNLKYATNAGGSWTTETVDSDGVVGWSTSIAVDSSDKVHISYKDSTNGDLKYATNAGGSWSSSAVDSAGDVGSSASIAVDSGGWAHISYYDSTNGDLKYATNVGDGWASSTIDSVGDVGGTTSIAVDSSDRVHISYGNITNGDLKYATNAGGGWAFDIVDSTGDVSSSTSIAVDSADKVHIVYYEATERDLRHATNAGGTWSVSTVDDTGDVGKFTSMAVDSADKVHISFYDATSRDLKYATNASGEWAFSEVDEYDDVGWYTSVAVDSADKVHISYYDFSNAHLKYATFSIVSIPEFSADDITPSTWQDVTFTGSASDPDGNPMTFTVAFGDGSYYVESFGPNSGETFTMTVDHAYLTAGPKTARLYVSDGTANTSSSPLVISVWLNYPPEEFVLPDINACTNELVTVTVDTYDLDGDDLMYSWAWGDGAVDVTMNVATASHTYMEPLDSVYCVYVDDGQGHNVTSEAIVHVQVSFTLNLEAGWNLVTVPLVDHGYKASTLGLSFGDMVSRWDPATQTYGKNYIVGISGSSMDFDIEPSWGYWVATNTAKSIVVYGELATVAQERIITVPSEGGWVQAGLASMQTGLWASDLVDMCTADMVSMISRWNAATQTYSSYIVQFGIDNFQLNPGDGMWWYVEDSGVLSYDP